MKLKFIVFFILSFRVCFSNEVSFTQGNPPRQNQVKRDHPIIFTMDILFGKVEFVAKIAMKDGNPGITEPWAFFAAAAKGIIDKKTLYDIRLIKNRAKIGFATGIGLALNRMFNLGLNWKYLRSGRNDHAEFNWREINGVAHFLRLGLQGIPNSVTGFPNQGKFPVLVDASNHFRNRLHILDLILQTSHWMVSKLLFQPFGGLRYLYHKSTSNTYATFTGGPNPADTNRGTFTSNERYVQSSLALIFGTDIKYLIWKEFFFFSTFLAQIMGDLYRKTDVFMNNTVNLSIPGQGIFDHTFRDTNLNTRLIWEQKFGFAWERVFGDDWLLSFRIFIERQEHLFKNVGAGCTILF